MRPQDWKTDVMEERYKKDFILPEWTVFFDSGI